MTNRLSFPSYIACCSCWVSISNTEMNNNREMVSPYHNTIWACNRSVNKPSTSIEKEVKLMHMLMKPLNVSLNTIICNNRSTPSHLIKSNAFLKSSEMHALWPIPILLKLVVNTCAKFMLSLILLECKNHVWFFEIKFERTTNSLDGRIFEITLLGTPRH